MKPEVDRLYDAYVFDLDGTLYMGNEALPGALSVVRTLREAGRPVRFLSNNPTRNKEGYLDKLRALGFEAEENEVVTTVDATARWLKKNHPGAVVFPIAEEPVLSALRDAGIATSHDPSEIDIVLASYDRTFDYQKLQIAFDALWQHKRAFLMATNPDAYCPFPGGRGEPDCAAIVAAIEASTGVKNQVTIGKPNPHILLDALAETGVQPSQALMVGDRLGTDIAMATGLGMDSALVLTGDSTREQAASLPESDRPTYVLGTVGDLLPR